MKYDVFCCQRLFVSTLLFLSIFSIDAWGQTSAPDPEIVRQMVAYVRQVEDRSVLPRPQVTDTPSSSRLNAQNHSVIEKQKVSAANPALERKAFDLVNEQRVLKGLPRLKWNEEMARVARLHSSNMARYKFFGHQGPDGSTLHSRARSLGARGWYALGENIAFNRGFSKPVEMACQHWMSSRGHRENILDRGWTEAGIGVAIAADGSHYFTQVFMTR